MSDASMIPAAQNHSRESSTPFMTKPTTYSEAHTKYNQIPVFGLLAGHDQCRCPKAPYYGDTDPATHQILAKRGSYSGVFEYPIALCGGNTS